MMKPNRLFNISLIMGHLLIADTFDQYLSDNPPAQITDDGFGNPVVVEEDN